jgi:hypothetical protein
MNILHTPSITKAELQNLGKHKYSGGVPLFIGQIEALSGICS